MNFLLTAINAKYIHSNPAVYSLKAYAGDAYREFITIAEYTINNRMEEILQDIYRRKPDVIGFSCYIWNIGMVYELLNEIPKVLPGIEIWLGGPEVSFEGEALLSAYPGVKGIMVGEGEETFKELVSFYLAKEEGLVSEVNLSLIAGLHLRNGYTGERTAEDISELPFYYESLNGFENRIVYYESSRGCPFRCSYCLSSIDKQVRLRKIEFVKRELLFFMERQVPQVKFIDRTFNCNHLHAMEIWEFIKDHDNGITNFHFEIAADILSQEEINLLSMLRPGLVQLEIGVQSTNEKTLKEINRYARTEKIAQAVLRLKQNHNIHIHLDLIAGLPFEDRDSFRKSFNDVYKMEPEQLQLGFLKVLKGALMHERAESYGIVYQSRPPYEVLYTNWITYDDITRLKRIEEMVELYYNSNQFTCVLPVLQEVFDSPFDMFDELSLFFGEKGYFKAAPARVSRYRILLEFACRKNPERELLYRELLTFDFYLRENAKSRPEYAGDLSSYKDAVFQFYKKEEEHPVCLASYGQYHARQTLKMTHLEVFHYHVWEKESSRRSIAQKEVSYVLFDYQVRDPLTGDAQVLNVTEYF